MMTALMRQSRFLLPAAALLAACAEGPTPSAPPPTAPPSVTLAAPRGDMWYQRAVFYEVFVRSFQDSDGDGVGDLKGLISRLDYLNDGNPATTGDLGVDALWLMPVFDSPSYHGYDVVDYERIEPDYGTLEDFQRLCDEAHRRGMRVILDFVINHTSAAHPWFADSASSPTSPRRNWYVWSDRNLAWNQPWDPVFSRGATWHERGGAWYYGVFWGGMPDLNLRTPAVREEVKRLATLWLERGADGFRLDAARYLIETGSGPGQADTQETHAFWKEFAAHVRGVKPDAVLVGENWTTTNIIAGYYGATDTVPGGDELPLNFNFPLAERILDGVNSGDAAGIATTLRDMAATYPEGVADAPFLTNHDHVRVATVLGGDTGRLRSAAALLLTLPGSPFLYYGEEVGLLNTAGSRDEFKRTPMPWDASAGGGFTTGMPWHPFSQGQATANVAAQRDEPGSLLSHYRNLVRVRGQSQALSRGGLRLLSSSVSPAPTLAFLRTLDGEQVLVVHQLSSGAASVGPLALEGATVEPLFTDGNVRLTGQPGAWTAQMNGRSTGIWRVR
jgi:glycosidase